MPDIRFEPHRKQWEAYQYLTDHETSFIGYGGAAFGGKSYLICYNHLINCLAYPNTRWGLGRRELTTLKKTTLMTLFKVFQESGIKEGEHYNYNQQLNIIKFFNDSEILLIDTAYKPSDPLYQRFGGYELTGCAIDESGETEYKAIEILFTRCGRWRNKEYNIKAKMLECFNPSKGHVYSRYYKPFIDGNLKPSYKFVKALPKDNPSPEAFDYINGIVETADKITIERLIYGNFEYDDDPMALIDEDSISDAFTNEHVIDGEELITADIARFGKDTTEVWHWAGWKLKAVYIMKKNSITEAADFIKKLASNNKIPMSRVIVDEDGVGGGVKDILKCEGFIANSKPIESTILKGHSIDNYKNLKTQCAFISAKMANTKNVMLDIHPDKDKVKEELRWLKRKENDSEGKIALFPKEEIKKAIGRSPDSLDNLIMRGYFEVRKKRATISSL